MVPPPIPAHRSPRRSRNGKGLPGEGIVKHAPVLIAAVLASLLLAGCSSEYSYAGQSEAASAWACVISAARCSGLWQLSSGQGRGQPRNGPVDVRDIPDGPAREPRDGRGCSSPAAVAPLPKVGALGSQRRVVAVAGIHPGWIGEPVEQALGHVIEQQREGVRTICRRAAGSIS